MHQGSPHNNANLKSNWCRSASHSHEMCSLYSTQSSSLSLSLSLYLYRSNHFKVSRFCSPVGWHSGPVPVHSSNGSFLQEMIPSWSPDVAAGDMKKACSSLTVSYRLTILRKELDLCILSMCVCSSRIECHRSVLAQAHTIWMYAPTHHMYPYVSTGMSRMCIYVYSCNYTCSYSYAVYTYVYI